MITIHDAPGTTPLLLLHSALGTHAEMLPIAQAFPDRTVLTLDLPEHGEGPRSPRPLTSAKIGEWVLEELHRAKIEEVDVIGYSLGGYVAIEAAIVAQRTRPNSIRSIISHAMKFYWTPTAIESAVGAMAINAVSQSPKYLVAMQSLHSEHLPQTLDAVATLITGFTEKRLNENDVRSLGIPLLLTTGERDEMVPPPEVAQLGQAAGAQHQILVGVRHPIKTLNVAEFALAAHAFWNGIPQGRESAKTETI